MNKHTAYIGLGSNLQDPLLQIKQALAALASLPSASALRVSPLYQSQAIGPGEQPDYLNGVVEISTTLAPLELLEQLQNIEHQQGRQRTLRWGARTIDLDVLLYDDITLHSDRLELPHPRLEERNFVIYPLYDLAPTLVLPNGRDLKNCKHSCSSQGIARTEHTL